MKPMLSATLTDPKELKFPVMVSPKLDGFRCIMANGTALSRYLKPFRNKYVQKVLGSFGLDAVDGELIVGEPNGQNVWGATSSGVTSIEGEPDFTYWVFDSLVEPGAPYKQRFMDLDHVDHPRVKIVPHYWLDTIDEFIEMEQQFINDGYEGIMIRGPYSPYKFGRATASEHSLFKFKRFNDGEAVVISVLEGIRNENEATRDATGKLTRSSHQDNLALAGRVGTIVVREKETGNILNVSPGRMVHTDRIYYWNNPEEIVGKTITIKWFDYGKQNAPRFCTFQRFRMEA